MKEGKGEKQLRLQDLKADCSFVAGSSFVPLGHMLTHKIAYQIVTGLAYLHKKNIIFCDLKSDNILVWSLDVKEHVNIKLSDYGISRQSFHEGALGVEGTPGYQAPEIRPRIVYDEKVTVDFICGWWWLRAEFPPNCCAVVQCYLSHCILPCCLYHGRFALCCWL